MSTGTDTSVYVHFPWCLKRCPYCDFTTRKIDRGDVPHRAYADAIMRELEARGEGLGERRLTSVFFGGGTPSLWDAGELGRVLRGIRGAFGSPERRGGQSVDPEVEVTVECNPSSLDEAHAAALVEAGVNRLSVGVQSFDDERLRFLGRFHDSAGAVKALECALKDAPRVSADLMFGTVNQDTVDDDLSRVLDLGIEHVSAYALTIEPGTQFGELHRKGRLQVASEEDYASMFRAAGERFSAAGWGHYEVSNYAVPGEESRHNQHYWRGGAYLGLGAAAVGCLDESEGRARRWKNEGIGEDYIAGSQDGRFEAESEDLDGEMIVREAIMLGLRTAEGVDLHRTAARSGVDPRAGRGDAITRRVARGDLIDDGDRLRVPRERWILLDGIIADLF
ncbi:MAG: coproporphyrinogen III oxidase family protein [Deltaproteobacteria bacterium]|nr:MAG: coproporphyrinogen III oxidase family protein [Deltaproteobacteria bacterium]